MSYEVGVTDWFESAHSLKGEMFGSARGVHGHSYKVKVVVEGKQLSKDGTLCDITEIKNALSQVVGKLHYKVLDEVDALSGVNSTAEEMARYIHEQVSSMLSRKEGIDLLKVIVWENQANFASFKDSI